MVQEPFQRGFQHATTLFRRAGDFVSKGTTLPCQLRDWVRAGTLGMSRASGPTADEVLCWEPSSGCCLLAKIVWSFGQVIQGITTPKVQGD